jgi:hypothetical protein
MGDYGDITVDDGCAATPHSGKTCLKIAYSAKGSQGAGWMGIYWQNPANNWGTQMGGYDLKGYKKLTFWARGEKGGEKSEFKVGGIKDHRFPHCDSFGPESTGVVKLAQEWQKYEIDLKGKDLSSVLGGFCWVTNNPENPRGCTIYLDDIKFEGE